MSHDVAIKGCSNTDVKYLNRLPDGFQPNGQTMSMLHKSVMHHVDLLFKKIVTINFEDFVLGPELQEGACPFSQFQEIKSDVQCILAELIKLHVYVNDINVADNFELSGIFLKQLLIAWDKFFCSVCHIRFKRCSKRRLKHLRRLHSIAELKTRTIWINIETLQRRIEPAMQSCGVRNEEKIKEEFFESVILFKLDPCKIEAKGLDDMEIKETSRKRKRSSKETDYVNV